MHKSSTALMKYILTRQPVKKETEVLFLNTEHENEVVKDINEIYFQSTHFDNLNIKQDLFSINKPCLL